ncbi:zinc-dependent peptidase [Agriterribacter sp.]|uniref:zinc-dependent peptidase n=1 Tax=Agriterribacter sp. TaxID=2821509 RepID=UPI002CE43920|nr:zinc-dependent peptidase [Agriterribacter sp.]HTN05796.1 zinc-dependent peptidase [Agriterribacter sp.]
MDWKYKVFEQEKAPGNDFYSAYALTNFQEFWAESVELFFERPAQLQIVYPDLYKIMVVVLNQDPLHS